MCVMWAIASVPKFNGRYEITGIDELETTNSWRLIGTFADSSLQGWDVTSVTTNMKIYVDTQWGDIDRYVITNVVTQTGLNLTCDVNYDEEGAAPRTGMPTAGSRIICEDAYLPSLQYDDFTDYLRNGARNLLIQALMDSSGGGAGTITNLLSTDSSVAITDSGGAQPDLSVTGYVRSVVSGYATTNIITDLASVSNAVDVLETNTAPVQSFLGMSNRFDIVETNYAQLPDFNSVSGRVDNIEGRTSVWEQAATDATSATGSVADLETTFNSHTNNESADIQHLTEAEKLTATNARVDSLNDATGHLRLQDGTNTSVRVDGTNIYIDASGGGVTGSGLPDVVYTGDTTTVTGKLYQQNDDSTWSLACNTNVDMCKGLLGVAVGTNSSSTGMVVLGTITVTDTFTIGTAVFVSDTAGEFTQTAPSDNGSVIRVAGFAVGANELYVAPSPTWVEIGELITEDINFFTKDATNIGHLQASTFGNINLSDNDITNAGTVTVTNLIIKGGSPTEGAVWTGTDTDGNGTWRAVSYVSAILSANATIANTTATTINFNTENKDTLSEYNNATGVFTASRDGIYLVTGCVTWLSVDKAKAYYVYIVTSTETYYYKMNAPDVMGEWPILFSESVELDAGQTCYIRVYQNSGGDESVEGSANPITRLRITSLSIFE